MVQKVLRLKRFLFVCLFVFIQLCFGNSVMAPDIDDAFLFFLFFISAARDATLREVRLKRIRLYFGQMGR